jgi:nitroreductase
MDRTYRPAGDAAAADDAIRFAVEAAILAPSVHNTQPWWFGGAGPDRVSAAAAGRGGRISLHADVDRRLNVADPDGREMLISCGAALFTLRVAIRDLGHDPEVTVLPDPDRPSLLADVVFGDQVPRTEENALLFQQIRRRRTHRGAFSGEPVPSELLATLRREVADEGAELRIVTDDRARAALGALTEAADHVQRTVPAYRVETARWAPPPGAVRQDGVPEAAYPREPYRTEPHYPMRDFSRGQGWGADADEAGPTDAEPGRELVTGVVALLTTPGDLRTDWLRAGQALQRLLLRATADEVSAAFHTQALEVPELREFVRGRFCDGAHPQMLLRLGRPSWRPGAAAAAVRRPVADVVADDQ